MEEKLIQELEKHLQAIPFDLQDEKEEWILTKEEEISAVSYAISQAKKYKAWKFARMKLSELDILQRMSVIDWELEIDKEEVLRQCNSNKNQNLWFKQRRKEEKEEAELKRQKLIEQCDAKYMFRLMSWASREVYDKKLILHDDNKKLISALCFFTSRDQRLETELGLSLKKGLLIRGASGLGKTHLVKCLENNELNPICIASMIEIADRVRFDGEYELGIGNNRLIYLDDVGTEEATVNHYGTKINWFKNFIETFYLKNTQYNMLIISTNNSAAEIEEKYGFRVRSRIREMFNIVDVSGKDMRE